MNVLVDTSIWSLAFRKKEKTKEEERIVNLLAEYTRDLKVKIIGPIRQEILSGISENSKFELLREKLAIFNDVEITTSDYEKAAEYFNLCRSNGIQGSHIDYLICSVAKSNNFLIYT